MASASETISTPKMIVPYEWILENVEEQTTTIASKMIIFLGEKVFRVGLQNHAISPILFFMAIDLGKIGMKVEDVKYGIQGSGLGPATMMEMPSQNIGDEGSLQLFTIKLAEKVVGHCTFMFRICIEGTDSGYSYQLCDRLAKDQLWAALKNQQYLPDVELIVKDKSFPAHKAILAARSRAFADEFEKVQPVKDVPHQIRIDGVEPSTVENILYFIYTGETMGTLADEKLLELANHYGLLSLSGLCRVALKEIEAAMQMANVMDILNNGIEVPNSSSKIM
jgi:speckle-type POZ protein